jgi:hypothetical protein
MKDGLYAKSYMCCFCAEWYNVFISSSISFRRGEMFVIKKKALAYWGAVCPGCNIGRKYPESFIGKRIVEHWKQGCPLHEAYKEVFLEKDKAGKAK